MEQFLVFMCPTCRHFTNAPLGQQHRRCSYCGKIIDISKAAVALFENQNLAIAAVKEFNAGKSDEFQLAVERSRERLSGLIPSKKLTAEEIASVEGEEGGLPTGKMSRLMRMLEREARDAPCEIDRLRSVSES